MRVLTSSRRAGRQDRSSKKLATARLEHVQQVIHEELGWAVTQARQEGADRSALADVILKLAGEVRQQLGLQLAISRTLVDLKFMKDFRTPWLRQSLRSHPMRPVAS
jgi:hypothetical protein